jgi:hypothetical protein
MKLECKNIKCNKNEFSCKNLKIKLNLIDWLAIIVVLSLLIVLMKSLKPLIELLNTLLL